MPFHDSKYLTDKTVRWEMNLMKMWNTNDECLPKNKKSSLISKDKKRRKERKKDFWRMLLTKKWICPFSNGEKIMVISGCGTVEFIYLSGKKLKSEQTEKLNEYFNFVEAKRRCSAYWEWKILVTWFKFFIVSNYTIQPVAVYGYFQLGLVLSWTEIICFLLSREEDCV